MLSRHSATEYEILSLSHGLRSELVRYNCRITTIDSLGGRYINVYTVSTSKRKLNLLGKFHVFKYDYCDILVRFAQDSCQHNAIDRKSVV